MRLHGDAARWPRKLRQVRQAVIYLRVVVASCVRLFPKLRQEFSEGVWIARHASELPQISLDTIREEMGAEPTGNQGAVVQTAREKARVLLRSGDDFV
jgi:hypothetical protein